MDVWQWTSLVFLIIYAGLSGLPREPFEAANLDGANSFTIFTKITIPEKKYWLPLLGFGLFMGFATNVFLNYSS